MNIIDQICEFSGVTLEEIKSGKRTERITMCRHVIASFLYSTNRYSQETIGEMLEMNHSSVHNAVKKIKTVLENEKHDPIFRSYLEKLKEKFPTISFSAPLSFKKSAEIKRERHKLLFDLGLLHWQEINGMDNKKEIVTVTNQLHEISKFVI